MKGSRPLESDETRHLKNHFSGRWGKRNRALFYLGVNTGFRISELLAITLGDLIDQGGKFKNHVSVSRRYMKGKNEGRTVLLNSAAKRALDPWVRELEKLDYTHRDDFVFQTQHKKNKAISVVQGWRVLTQAFHAAGLPGPLSTHAMRKTFGNNFYSHFRQRQAAGENVDPFRYTSKALGHKDIKSTDQYLSFNQEDIDLAINSIEV